MVVAIPVPLSVEGDDEEVVLLNVLQQALAVILVADGVAELCGEAGKHGGMQQKRLDLLRLLSQHFIHEKIRDVAIAATQAVDEGMRSLPPLQRQRHELETGDPPLGARREASDIGRYYGKLH